MSAIFLGVLGRSTGNDVSGHYKRHSFIYLFFPPSSTFLIEGVLLIDFKNWKVFGKIIQNVTKVLLVEKVLTMVQMLRVQAVILY